MGDEPQIDRHAPRCAAEPDALNADWYWHYDVYSCAWPVAAFDADGDGLGAGVFTVHTDNAWPDLEVSLACDNCPDLPNLDQRDADCDAVGDPCDNCPDAENDDQLDTDEDGFGDACDVCPLDVDPDQADTDADGVGDYCDACPEDADPDQANADGDAWGDACDGCPTAYDTDPRDLDGDGFVGACDGCPELYDPDQADRDGDGVGDACDACPITEDADQADGDADGFGDACDVCPEEPDTQDDRDDDGVGNACDNCVAQPNPDQADANADGYGDACARCDIPEGQIIGDLDDDGIPDPCDVCPLVPDHEQADGNGDGIGDACTCPGTTEECAAQFRGGAAECGAGLPLAPLAWIAAALAVLRRRGWLVAPLLGACQYIDDGEALRRLDPDDDGVPWPKDCDSRDPGVAGPFVAYPDADDDGWGGEPARRACSLAPDLTTRGGDCDDADPDIHPDSPDVCDGIDQDCDGLVDEVSEREYWYADADADGFGQHVRVAVHDCLGPAGAVPNDDDCDDQDATVHPGALETCDGLDEDCDGDVDEFVAQVWYRDLDGDGYGADGEESCGGAGLILFGGDCDDADPAVSPAAVEVCDDGVDDDCNGVVDDPAPWHPDVDGDGFGDPNVTRLACAPAEGEVADDHDCNDARPGVNPAAREDCDDGIDNDCDGAVDLSRYWGDADADGLGDPDVPLRSCGLRPWLADNAWDCDDADPFEPVVADPVGGSSAGDGSMALPFQTLQEAVDAATTCVVALPGTYVEHVDLSGRTLDVWGVFGPRLTVLDPGDGAFDPLVEAAAPVLRFAGGAGATSTVRGFTVRGGSGEDEVVRTSTQCEDGPPNGCALHRHSLCGGGVYVDGDAPVLRGVVIVGNEASPRGDVWDDRERVTWRGAGGGACVASGTLTLEDVDVLGNVSGSGGGVWIGAGGALTATRVRLAENEAGLSGGAMRVEGAATLRSVATWCNRATGTGGAIHADAGATVDARFVTLAGDGTRGPGAAVYAEDAGFTLRDAVVEAVSVEGVLYGAGSVDWSTVTNPRGAATSGFTLGDHVLDLGSVLAGYTCNRNPDDDDLRLVPAGAAADVADPADGTDPDGSAPDLGAWGGPDATW